MAMRSVRSSVAKGKISDFMERAWVQDLEKRGDKLPLIVTGAFVYGNYKSVSDLYTMRAQFSKEEKELATLVEHCKEKEKAFHSKKKEVLMMVVAKEADTK